jgi:hypothetical protein
LQTAPKAVRARGEEEEEALFMMTDQQPADTHEQRSTSGGEVDALADRMLDRAICSPSNLPPDVRTDMLLAVGCLRVLAWAFPDGSMTVGAWRSVNTVTYADAVKLADHLTGMADLRTYATQIGDLQPRCIIAGRLIRAMLRQVNQYDFFTLSPDRPTACAGHRPENGR